MSVCQGHPDQLRLAKTAPLITHSPPVPRPSPLASALSSPISHLSLLFVALATTYSVVTPIFENHDEPSHYPVVKYIADHGRLPVQGAGPALGNGRQEASQPPLYYLLAAAATFWIPTGDPDHVWRGNPHTRLGRPTADPVGNKNMVIHTAAEDFPWHGVALAVHLARFISVACGLVTVLCAHAIARLALPGRPTLALATAAITAFNPMFLFVTGSVNNDNLAVALCSLGLLLTLRAVVCPARATYRLAIVLGVVLGLAALSKLSGLTLVPLIGLGFGYATWLRRREGKFRTSQCSLLVSHLSITYGVAALVAGWWFWRNWALYRDPLGLSAMLDNVGRRPPGWSLLDLATEFEGFRQSYWAVFGGFSVLVPRPIYHALDALTVLAGTGLLLWLARRWRRPRWPPALPLAFLALYALVVFASLIRWTMMTSASAGRLLFPAVGAISTLMVLGWSSLTPRRWSALPPLTIAGGMAAFGALVPFTVLQPAFARPPLLNRFDTAVMQHRVGLAYREPGGGEMRLLGYDLLTPIAEPGGFLSFRLYWQVARPLADDDSIFIHLLPHALEARAPGGEAAAEAVLVGDDTYPGNGGYATSALPMGAVLPERHNLRLPPDAATGLYRMEIGLYVRESMRRLEAVTSDGQLVPGDTPVVFHVRIDRPEPPPPPLPTTSGVVLGDRLRLIAYRLPERVTADGLTLEADWQALGPLWRDYTFSYQLLDLSGALAAQHDSMPRDGAFPTSLWPTTRPIRDHAALPAPTGPGPFRAVVAVYDGATRERLRGPEGDSVPLGTVRSL